MTFTEYRKKYPIGTKIKFIAGERSCTNAQRDNGKIGKITEYMAHLVGIYLPNSDNNIANGTTTWLTSAKNLQILPQKNEQLVFAFMD